MEKKRAARTKEEKEITQAYIKGLSDDVISQVCQVSQMLNVPKE